MLKTISKLVYNCEISFLIFFGNVLQNGLISLKYMICKRQNFFFQEVKFDFLLSESFLLLLFVFFSIDNWSKFFQDLTVLLYLVTR